MKKVCLFSSQVSERWISPACYGFFITRSSLEIGVLSATSVIFAFYAPFSGRKFTLVKYSRSGSSPSKWRKIMSLNIEPRLQTIIDAHLAIARQTLAKDVPDTESLATSILLTLAGRGLAKLEVADGKPIWVAGKDLARADEVLGSKPLAVPSLCRGLVTSHVARKCQDR
jgi:hypothetical protein